MERPTDKTTGKNRGFCFITFKKDGVIRECCNESEHKLDGQQIDVKEAVNQMGRNQRGFMGRGHFMGNREFALLSSLGFNFFIILFMSIEDDTFN